MRSSPPPVRSCLSPAVLAVVAATLPLGAAADTYASSARVSEAAVRSSLRIEAAIRAVSEVVRRMSAPASARPAPPGPFAERAPRANHPSTTPDRTPTPWRLARLSLIDLPPPAC